MSGTQTEPLARIKVDEKHCFGMIEWNRFLPQHTAAAGWMHRSLFHVEQEGLAPMPKDRGAEQGDVDGSLECSQALGMVAAEKRVDAWRRPGSLPWIGVDGPSEKQRLQAEHTAKLQRVSHFRLHKPEKLTELTIHDMICKKMEEGLGAVLIARIR